VKFGALLERGRRAGFDAVATGHYAISRFERGAWRLSRSADRNKDQSYVLSTLRQEALAFARFPVGAQTKEETRAIARELSLRTADKPDSYEICFVSDGDAGGFVETVLGGTAPGEIVDVDGAVVGEHQGLPHYTIGQRRGLGLATHEKRYVLEVDAPRNRVVVGPGELLGRRGLIADRVSWVAGEAPSRAPFEAEVRLRYRGDDVPCAVEPLGDTRVRIEFRSPQRAVAPGQSAVLYGGEEVLGGGRIVEAIR
jgi:tRNA-specific 2-thiouridylase